MIIVETEKRIEVNYYITTDEEYFPFYRRSEHGIWENMMGESWEPVHGNNEKRIEQLFQQETFK